jgi:hypothetical protein
MRDGSKRLLPVGRLPDLEPSFQFSAMQAAAGEVRGCTSGFPGDPTATGVGSPPTARGSPPPAGASRSSSPPGASPSTTAVAPAATFARSSASPRRRPRGGHSSSKRRSLFLPTKLADRSRWPPVQGRMSFRNSREARDRSASTGRTTSRAHSERQPHTAASDSAPAQSLGWRDVSAPAPH